MFFSVECPGCHAHYADNEVTDWYGCDTCDRWWHRYCLPTDLQAKADLSCMEKSILFECPACVANIICQVCLVEANYNCRELIKCQLCFRG